MVHDIRSDFNQIVQKAILQINNNKKKSVEGFPSVEDDVLLFLVRY